MRIRIRRPRRRGPDDLPRLPLRRRLLTVVLAAAAAVVVMVLLLERPGDPKRGQKRVVPETPPCKPGQTTDCVGGKADVIVVTPRAASASR